MKSLEWHHWLALGIIAGMFVERGLLWLQRKCELYAERQ
jgi:hypothetical protein